MLRGLAMELDEVGKTKAAEALRQIADAMSLASKNFSDGNITGEQLLDTMNRMGESASGLLSALGSIDGVSFDFAIGALQQLSEMLDAARQQAVALRLALPGATSGATTPAASGPAGGPVSTGPASARAAPWRPSVRPQLRPTDIDFGYVEPQIVGGGGGGRTPSPAEPAYWDDLVQSVQDAQDALEDYNDAADTGADKMADLFLAATEGADAAKEALAQLLLELAKVAAQSAFTSMAGAGSPLQPIFAAIGSAFGGFRAEGGPVSTGQSYVVGENGPELFTPGASGMITPNHAMGGSGGGVEILVRSEPGTIVEIARNTANAAIRQAAPVIEGRAVAQSSRAMRSTKSYGNMR
jgi:hypothetical protein